MNNFANPFADFTKAFSDVKMPVFDMPAFDMPAFDMEGFAAMQKKNIEAMTTANQAMVDGARAIFERQVQIAQQSVEEAQAAVKNITEGKTKFDADAQVTQAKAAMEKAAANIRELSEIAAKSQNAAFDTLNKRFVEGVEESKEAFKLN